MHESKTVLIDLAEIEVVVTCSGELDDRRVPVTVYVNHLASDGGLDYVYAIGSFSTPLASNDHSKSSTNSLALLLQKKLQRPVYLGVSDSIGEEATVPIFQAVMEVFA